MRTLTATLQAAQRSLEGQRPVIKLDISDRPVEIPRWDWSVIVSEAVSTCHGAAALASDGSVVRVRVKTDGSLQVARFTDPTTDANWSAWTNLAAGPYYTGGQAAIACDASGATVVIAYVSADGRSLLYRVSTDYGATYGAEQTALTEAAGMAIKGLGGCNGAGYAYFASSTDTGGAEPNDLLKVHRYAGGTWTVGLSDPGHDSVTSVGCYLDGTRQLVVLGGAAGLKRRDYDWSTPAYYTAVELATLGSSLGWSLDYPRLTKSPDGSGRYFFTFLEQWTISLAGSRAWFHCSPSRDDLAEGVIFDSNRGKGFDIFVIGSFWYFVSSVAVYKAAKYSGSATQRGDAGADVVAFDVDESGPNRATRARVWLRNEDGRYATPGSGAYAYIREGSRVALGLGYKTSAGDEYVWLPPLWIERWHHEYADGESWLVLELGDAWRYLERTRARYAVNYASATYLAIVQRLAYRVSGATLTTAGGLSITAGAWTLRPGEAVAGGLRRLLDGAGCRLRVGTTAVSGDPGAWDAAVASVYAIGSGASGYSFGPSAHQVLRGEYGDRGQPVNLVEVFGSGHWDYRRDSSHIPAAGHVFLEKVGDWLLDSTADVSDRAVRELDQAQRQLQGGWLEVLPHLGAEVGDVVDVTDSKAGLSSAARRIAAIRWRYDGRRKGVWLQRLDLEAV